MNKPLHLSVLLPFCKERCAYCNHRVTVAGTDAMHEWLEALQREIRSSAEDFEDSRVQSVLLGGGSPSILPQELLTGLVGTLRQSFTFAEDAEWTLETSPNRINAQSMVLLQRLGINRLSIGVVTGRECECELLGMYGGARSAEVSMILPQMFHIPRYEAAILYGLPGQSAADFATSVRFCVKYKAPEIAIRPFCPPAGAAWQQRDAAKLPLASDEEKAAMLAYAQSHLTEKGYHEYLPGRWAKPGNECLQALGTEHGEDLLAFGAGTTSRTDGVVYRTTDNVSVYLQNADDPEKLYTVIGRTE